MIYPFSQPQVITYKFFNIAQLRVVEGDLGKSDTAGLLRKQKESLSHQLEMVLILPSQCRCKEF